MGLRRASQEGGGQGTALEAQGAMWMPCQGSPQSIWGEPRELPLASLYLHFPSSCLGSCPQLPDTVLLKGSGRTLSPLPNCCEQLSSGQPLASAEGPVLIKDNYIYSLAV